MRPDSVPSSGQSSAVPTASPAHRPESPARRPSVLRQLQHFPNDIARDSLIQVMRAFSFALGVRCQHCHTGGDGIPFQGVNFASDEKAAKKNARFMLRMVDSLNTTVLASMPARGTPAMRIECVTCHRGLSRPATLARTLAATIDQRGVDSAVAQYRELRKEMDLGKYDFGEWSLNELARTLREQEKTAQAIAILEVNGEFYRSPAIDMALGDLYPRAGRSGESVGAVSDGAREAA